jgi:NrS-1  polymerase HBD domain/Protein of unknown function (DUF3987)
MPLPVSPGAIPAELKTLTQWVCWSYEHRPERNAKKPWAKVPKNPATGSNASSTNPETWGTFDQAVVRYQGQVLDGIGFVVTKDDDYVAIDLDGCRNPEAGEIQWWAQAIIDRFASYTEVSPSGTGIRMFGKGRLPPHGRKKGAIEIYDAARFVTVTGCHLTKTSSTIEDRQAEIEAFHAEVFGEHRNQANRQGQTVGYGDGPSSGLSDEAILENACRAVNAEKFLCLWSGDISHYASPSEADLALCCLLVFWSHDPVQIDRLFRRSALMRPKWDEQRGGETYAQRTIRHALAQVTESWMPPHMRNGGPRTDEPLMPPLPQEAQIDEELAAEASPWLSDYIAWSRKWAPRAFEGFHEACGLFTLATVAARRIKIQLGHGVYTSLYMALAARTTLYTKTTGADLAIELLKRAGLEFLLADDDATPQAFLHAMTACLPEHCDELNAEAKVALCQRLAFAAQKGWFYEEFGQHLEAMMRRDGHMAAFRGILRRLDDHKEQYVYATIGRGREVLSKPYLTLLANVTPADLKPFATQNSLLWRDGYLARFGFIAPAEGTHSDAPFPDEAMSYPAALVTELRAWHKRLGIPRADIEAILDKKRKPTGRYRLLCDPLPETTNRLSPEVRAAFYRYDTALRVICSQRANHDLDGSYGRFAIKALRIAGLLASLHDDNQSHTIGLSAWYRGQQITERWRLYLHRLVAQIHADVQPSKDARAEQHILMVLKKHGALSLTMLHKWTKLSHGDLQRYLDVLMKAGVVREEETTRTTKYGLVSLESEAGEAV